MRGTAAAVLVAAAATLLAGEANPGAADAPDWLRQAARRPLTEAQRQSPAVVLLDEETSHVDASGDIRTRRRYVAKILTVEGRAAATLRALYLTDTGSVRDIHGWAVRPSGESVELGKTHVVDTALVGNDVYNEVRQRIIGLGPNPEPGVVFGAEVTTDGRSLFGQLAWQLQDRWPVARVARSVELPPGWRAASTTFNRDPVEPMVAGTTWTWALEDLSPIADEPAGAPWSSLAPRIAVTLDPGRSVGGPPSFFDWVGVSRWMAAQGEAASTPDASVETRARAEVGQAPGAGGMAALAAVAQRVQYVSIQIGMGRGGGYRPRPAAEVLAKGHGDCKDKASLLRALLAAIGQRAYLVAVFAGDPGYVREAWPSPHQFNHMIVGILVDETSRFPAAAQVPGIGAMLFFDPTDPFTPIGELPVADQGGFGLVLTPSGGALVRLPEASAEANRFVRTVDAVVDAAGGLSGNVRDRYTGGAAAAARADYRGQSAESRAHAAAGRVNAEIPRAELGGVAAEDGEREFAVTSSLRAPGYAQIIQGRLALVRCPTRLAALLPALGQAQRRTPVALEARSLAEQFVLALGPGLAIDELPAAISSEGAYGSCTVKVRRDGSRVVIEREITTRRVIVPPADYEAVRRFVEAARAVDGATIVLARGR
jgi:hypothetical protein